MTAREKLQLSYELAFYPPRLNALWRDLAAQKADACDAVAEALDDAARLQLALPESGFASQRALERLALYQARSRAYGMPRFIRAVRRRLNRPELADREVPARLVRDIALPAFDHPRRENGPSA
jgi:hypothetical protein